MKKIKQFREMKGLGQIEFSKTLGIAQPTLSKIEAGLLVPNFKTLVNISLRYPKLFQEIFKKDK